MESSRRDLSDDMAEYRSIFKNNQNAGSFHKRQKPKAPIRNRQTRKVSNAKGLNRNNLT